MNHTTLIGMDVHQKEIAIAMLKEKEDIQKRDRIQNTPEAMARFIQSFSQDESLSFLL